MAPEIKDGIERLRVLNRHLDEYDHGLIFRLSFGRSPLATLFSREDGAILRLNVALLRLLHYPPEKASFDLLKREGWIWLTHPDDRALDIEWAQKAAANEIAGYAITKRYRGWHDEWIWVRLNISFVHDPIHRSVAIVYVTPALIQGEAMVEVFNHDDGTTGTGGKRQ